MHDRAGASRRPRDPASVGHGVRRPPGRVRRTLQGAHVGARTDALPRMPLRLLARERARPCMTEWLPLGDRAIRFPRPPVSPRALVHAVRAWPGVIDVVVA